MRTHDDDFEPPFCPNQECRFHADPTGWEWNYAGTYERLAEPQEIQRFLCMTCNRSFSTQTFDTTYWLRRPDIQSILFRRILSCSGYRQIARELGVAHSTVQRQVERLGRHCLLFQHRHRPQTPPGEELVLDGFQSFEYSQYWPFHFNVLVGSSSHFLYAFTEAELRRSGRMTRAQKRRRKRLEERHGRPGPRTVVKQTEQLLRLVAPEPARLAILSDEDPRYPQAFSRLEGWEIEHRTISSKLARTTGNPLFPVNLLDLLIRHDSANHKRETIAYSKRRQSAVERLAVFQVWRNYMKPFSEKQPRTSPTPAQELGLMAHRLSLAELLSRRLFPSLERLPELLQGYYDRVVETRQIPNGRRHRRSYVY